MAPIYYSIHNNNIHNPYILRTKTKRHKFAGESVVLFFGQHSNFSFKCTQNHTFSVTGQFEVHEYFNVARWRVDKKLQIYTKDFFSRFLLCWRCVVAFWFKV